MSAPKNISDTVTDRFLRYTAIDTQSDPSSETCPSTEKQKNLGRLLVSELLEMDARHNRGCKRHNQASRCQL